MYYDRAAKRAIAMYLEPFSPTKKVALQPRYFQLVSFNNRSSIVMET